MEAIGKLTERKDSPTQKGTRYSLKFNTTEGIRTYSWFNDDALTLNYDDWYLIVYTEKENPNGQYPYKNISAVTVTDPPAAAPSGGVQDEFRRSKEEMRWTEAINNAVALMVPHADLEDMHDADYMGKELGGIAHVIYDIIIAGPPAATAPETSDNAPESAGEQPKRPDPPQSSLHALNAAREAASVSVERMQEASYEMFGTTDIRSLGETHIDQLIGSLENGDIAADLKPAAPDAAETTEG